MRRPAGALALCTAVIAGCGGDDEPAARTATVNAGDTVRVVGREYSFEPRNVVIDGAGGPATVRITLENRGALAHNLKLFEGEQDLGGTPTFQGGETKSVSVMLAPGRYRMVCTVGNHEQLGMAGSLELR